MSARAARGVPRVSAPSWLRPASLELCRRIYGRDVTSPGFDRGVAVCRACLAGASRHDTARLSAQVSSALTGDVIALVVDAN